MVNLSLSLENTRKHIFQKAKLIFFLGEKILMEISVSKSYIGIKNWPIDYPYSYNQKEILENFVKKLAKNTEKPQS